MNRPYNVDVWCIKKHLLSAKTHLEETIEKLKRECDEKSCAISISTRIEAEEALRQILAAEEHCLEVASKLYDHPDAEKFLKLADELRDYRQKLALLKIPFRVDLEVLPESIKVVNELIKKVDDMITEIDKYASEMEQEIECPRCREDLPLTEELKEKIFSIGSEKTILKAKDFNITNRINNLGDMNMLATITEPVLRPIANFLKVDSRYLWNIAQTEGLAGLIDAVANIVLTRFGSTLIKTATGLGLVAYGALGAKDASVRDWAYKVAAHLIVTAMTPKSSYDFNVKLVEAFNFGRLLGFGDIGGVQNMIFKSPEQVQAELKSIADSVVNTVKKITGMSIAIPSVAPPVQPAVVEKEEAPPAPVVEEIVAIQ